MNPGLELIWLKLRFTHQSDCDMIGTEWVQWGYHGYIMGIINKRLPSKLSRIKMISRYPKDFSPWDEGLTFLGQDQVVENCGLPDVHGSGQVSSFFCWSIGPDGAVSSSFSMSFPSQKHKTVKPADLGGKTLRQLWEGFGARPETPASGAVGAVRTWGSVVLEKETEQLTFGVLKPMWIRSDTWTPQPKLLGSIGRYPRPLWV